MKRLARIILPMLFWTGLVSVAPLAVLPAVAQRGPEQRVVQGNVEDKAGAPIKGATVFLKDTHTLAIKSFLSTANGSYHIGQLSPNADYEIWAELNGKKSSSHPISSFDTKKDFNIDLKINP
jgi:hypothetical protein